LQGSFPFGERHETDQRYCPLLRACSERPRDHRAAEEGDEFAPLHGIKSGLGKVDQEGFGL
jgi:hypothetical protein